VNDPVVPGVCAVGFVPSAPLLVPELAGPVAGEHDAVRAAARHVVEAILSACPEVVVVVAACSVPEALVRDGSWDFSGFGLPPRRTEGVAVLPWQLGLGDWLLDDREWSGRRMFLDASSPTPGLGGARAAYLAVGDGSVHLPGQPPDGHEAQRASFDLAVAAAIADGDPGALARIGAGAPDGVVAAGVPVWGHVAAVVGNRPVTTARLEYDGSPYGVHYLAGWWWV
jgi:hypothetical protein